MVRATASRACASELVFASRRQRDNRPAPPARRHSASLPRGDEGAPLAVVAEPLAPAHSETLGHQAKPGAVLFISDSEASTRPSTERLQVVYNLTPAEARLTALMVDGHDPASAASRLGVSANTVKYHLKTVFDKVGVGRQAELVRRVLADVGGLAEPDKLLP